MKTITQMQYNRFFLLIIKTSEIIQTTRNTFPWELKTQNIHLCINSTKVLSKL